MDGLTVIPGLAALWEEERERLRMKGLSSQLSLAPSEVRDDPFYTKTELLYLEKLQNQLHCNQMGSSLPNENTNMAPLSLDTSGYPSETPENEFLQNATLVEVHLPTCVNQTPSATRPPSANAIHSEEEMNKSTSQNSVLFDTQDEILMNDWGEMLEENFEDSILSTQTPIKNNAEPNIMLEETVEDVEDNHLLEMSQVFCLEENTVQVNEKNSDKLNENEENESTNTHANDGNLNQCDDGKSEVQSEDEKRSDGICEWEDFWDDENEADVDMEPIAQLDGTDDANLVEPNVMPGGKNLTASRRRLGIRGRTKSSLLDVGLAIRMSGAPSGPSGSSEHLPSTLALPPKSSATNAKNETSCSKSTSKTDDGFRPLIAIAKHRRINELKRQSRISLSVTKDKPAKEQSHDTIRPRASRIVGLSKGNTADSGKAKREIKSHSNHEKNTDAVSSTTINPTHVAVKPCTIRLEFLNEVLLGEICKKYGVSLSSYTANMFKETFVQSESLSHFLAQNDLPGDVQSLKKGENQKRSDKPGFKKRNLRRQLSFVIDEAFQDSSPSGCSNFNRGSMKDNSFSNLCSPIPLERRSNRKPSGCESKLSSPKSKKDRLSSGRTGYRPLDVKIQKSPVKTKVDLKCSSQSLCHALPLSPSSTSVHIEKSGDEKIAAEELENTPKKRVENAVSNDVESELSSSFDNIAQGTCSRPVMELRSSCGTVDFEVEEKNLKQISLHNSDSSNSTEEKIISLTRRKQKLSGEVPENRDTLKLSGTSSENKDVSDLEYFELTSDSSSRGSHDHHEAFSKKSESESSCDDGDLGIVSFCVEDVFDSSFPSPTFDGKSFRSSRRLIESQNVMSEGESKDVEVEEKEMLPSPLETAHETEDPHMSLYLSSDGNSSDVGKMEEMNQSTWYIEKYDENGFEFAPLLKAPSRKEVEDYKFDIEQEGLPFCSDPNDIPPKPMEVGQLVLRLHSNRPKELPQFENCLGCHGLEQYRKIALESTFGGADDLEDIQFEKISKSALLPEGGAREVIIQPCRDPPKYDDVLWWLNEGNCGLAQEKVDETSQSVSKKKIRLGIGHPLDPDNDDDDDSDMLSLSPCSSMGSQLSSHQVMSGKRSLPYQSTPHSSYKTVKLSDKLASPLENSMIYSPIEEHDEEEDLILCTPPPLTSEDQSGKREGKLMSRLHSFSRRKLIKEYISHKGDSEEVHCPLKPAESSKNKSCDPTTIKDSNGRKLDLKKILIQKSSHHVGLGGSGHSSCQIDGMSPNNTYGFQNSPNNFQDAKAIQQSQFITVMTMEVQVKTRGNLRPDPEYDVIQGIFYSVIEDGARQIETNELRETGMLIIGSSSIKKSKLIGSCDISLEAVQVVTDELMLFKTLGELVQKWDPDIFAGYEVEMLSWGYVIARGNFLGMDVKSLLSRIFYKNPAGSTFKDKKNTPFEMDSKRIKDSEDYDPIQLPGRIVLNVWRLMRSEAALMSYTFESVMYHLLHERIPSHSYKSLSDWWEHRTNLYRWITIEHWIIRVKGVMRLLVQLDIVGRTSELARLFGIQFYEVFSRGSQFRVESMMLRLAKPLNYVCVSPSSKQRASMRAPEQLPLIMEPESRFYADPVIVLDFQSLYPSMIIAYNYCFSTCLGRVKHLGQPGPFQFGCTNLMVAPNTISKLLNKNEDSSNLRSMISFSPCGVAFVGKEVRHGVLPKMLSEILETRLMVKKALKKSKGNRVVERVLNSRQLGLKLIANVTYGYTAANFSGRMPCVEVADSVVSKGRETLERAIALVHEKWGSQGVKVVYGDTDSLFVLAKGFSKSEAFKLGSQIAEAVTENNPKPVKLKLEKVYQPCLLQTKKRYVGYAYETPDQEKPIFDAKGIETVRRDGCPAVAKILEKSLRLLFDTRDVSLVKLHVQRQLGKLLSGRLSLQELTFAREYRGAAGYRPGACVPALQLARRWLSVDPRAEPRAGERVPYVIVNGPPGLPLFHLVRSPNELLSLGNNASTSKLSVHTQLQVNAHYYITKVLVPPLQRCFSLIGVDIEPWYADMPRKHRSLLQPTGIGGFGNVDAIEPDSMKTSNPALMGSKRSTIAEYFVTSDCLSCGMQLEVKNRATLCKACFSNPQSAVLNITGRCNSWERAFSSLTKLCQSCCQRSEPIECISLDCPVLYRRHQAIVEMEQAVTLRDALNQLS
ncbi:DNA polymerase zeta catalytic subunit-like [Hetaerina americana]|uniref:DNA polymerase zeta catalytic subunit-like n=1 Tax=Hetaerina americana TaxID=62018 RepID=UPI003A7F1724